MIAGVGVTYESVRYLVNRTLSLSHSERSEEWEGREGDGHPDDDSNDEETPCN
jgi:hypothetical protein